MARRPKIETAEDGSAIIRTKLQPSTWGLICKYAAKLDLDEEDAARVFLQQIDALIASNSLAWLSADWRALARDAPEASPKVAIDVSKLHRSERLKSGFYGVYANGQGFRAVGRQHEYLVTSPTAEEAAWHRYRHYVQHGLPYGELEIEIDRLRREGEAGSDHELRKIALETARLTGTLHLYAEHMTPEEIVIYGDSTRPAPQMLGFGADGLQAASARLAAHDEAEAQITRAEKP